MSHFSPTVNHYYGDNHKYINKIIEEDEIFIKDKQLNSFTRSFLRHYPLTQMNAQESLSFRDSIKQAYDFFSVRDTKTSAIKASHLSQAKQVNGSTIIQILGDDAPFLLDSTLSLLKRRNIKLYRVIHPIISCRRSDNGELLEIFDTKDLNDQTGKESLIHLQIQKIERQRDLDDLITDLRSVIDSVYLSVKDWRKMIKEVHNYTSFFEESAIADEQNLERKEFLEKLTSEYFVFIGAALFSVDPTEEKIVLDQRSLLGIMKKNTDELSKEIIKNLVPSTLFNVKRKNFIEIGKLNINSPIHRDVKIDYVCVKHYDPKLGLIGIHVFIGLFTSILYYQSSKLIPLIRLKVDYVLKSGGFAKDSYDGKEISSIIENLPRDELFRIKRSELASIIHEVSALLETPALRLFARENECKTSLTLMLFLPDVRFSSELSEKLEQKFISSIGGVQNITYKRINESRMGFYYIIVDKNINCPELDRKFYLKLEEDLEQITSTWRNKLKLGLLEQLGYEKGYAIYDVFKKSFPASYKVDFTDQDIIHSDIFEIINHQSDTSCFRIFSNKNDGKFYLKVYCSKEYRLSDLISIIQNFGFRVNYEVVYEINPAGLDKKFIHSFSVQFYEEPVKDINFFKSRLEDALAATWSNATPDDILNQLVISAELNYREVMFVRSIVKYLCQISIGYSKNYMFEVLTKHPNTISLLIELFAAMFNPANQGMEKSETDSIKKLTAKIHKRLSLISDAIEDKIVRACCDVVLNMLRTNYYVLDDSGKPKDYLAFKIDSEKMPGLPYPRPFREIFVYSSFFEAIHLRSSKVSRGGLRWSDRTEDFRTEILGLMKAQVAKNSIIVPTGSKGGFILKRAAKKSPEEYYALAVECYKNFLRGLLDITDNIVNGSVINPLNVVRYDEDDPYLVVAADKGTAKFSDFANSVSKEYGYWLGDAFASGGSAGYDHKQIGITARGAWISVDRHFTDLGINSQKDDFTVAGIGDMSGDVFGNGLLLSEHIKLLAAFNHMHIFIDPAPEPIISYKERKRLFELPRSSWIDYNSSLISKGGAIFERSSKILELSKEIKDLFGLKTNEISPNELVKLIIKMRVDLFWNGGIGTYVKASDENNIEVGDKSNDFIRINGNELGCKVFAEGGNLGLTQRGRIEYALKGGHINTDAIDNSAGVDCSDHEVNIKIAFNKALENNKLSIEQRDKLLEKMTDNVAHLVLQDNYQQNVILTIAEHQSLTSLSNYDRLIKILENFNYIDRKLEHLPTSAEFALRASNKLDLTKPELSTLLAFTKNHVASDILKTDLVDDEYFEKDLINYFPKDMQKDYLEEINSHPLRREIIATIVTNNMLNRLSCYFPHLASEDMGISISTLTKAYTITSHLFDTETLWSEITKLDGKIAISVQVELLTILQKFICRSASWMLRNIDLTSESINHHLNKYKDGVKEINIDIKKILRGAAKTDFTQLNKKYLEHGVNTELASKIALLNALSATYNIVYIASETKQPVLAVAEIYFEVAQRLNYDWLKSSIDRIDSTNDWQRLSVTVYKDELFDLHRSLITNIIANHGTGQTSVNNWFEEKSDRISRYSDLIEEIKKNESFENSMVPLIIQRLYGLLKK